MSVPLVLWIFAFIKLGRIDYSALIACLILPVGFFLWLWAFRIEVRNGVLTYRTLTSRRQIQLSEIEKSWIETGLSNKSEGLVRLVIKPIAESGVDKFSINIKPFALGDLQKLYPIVKLAKRGMSSHRRKRQK
jgi:hypothetical protein